MGSDGNGSDSPMENGSDGHVLSVLLMFFLHPTFLCRPHSSLFLLLVLHWGLQWCCWSSQFSDNPINCFLFVSHHTQWKHTGY